MSEIKLYKNILSAENIFLSSEFSLGFYASFRSKKIGGGCMPSANITTACLGLDWGQSGRSYCFHPGTVNACARVEAMMGARCACCEQVPPCGVGFLIVSWGWPYLSPGIAVSMHLLSMKCIIRIISFPTCSSTSITLFIWLLHVLIKYRRWKNWKLRN